MVLLGEGQTLRLRVGPFQEVRRSGASASPDTSRLGTDPMYVGGRRKLVPSFSEERRPLALSCVCFGSLADSLQATFYVCFAPRKRTSRQMLLIASQP